MKKRIMSILVCLSIFAALLPVLSIRVAAADSVTYIDIDGSEKSAAATRVTDSISATWNTGWYYVQGTVNILDTVTVSGNVNLILTDGSSLTVGWGTKVEEENSLTIYGQSSGTGALTTTGGSGGAGIGGGGGGINGGTITINGGTITATAPYGGAGIGGGRGGDGGTITINGGTVTATGNRNAAGIGGGREGSAGTITINGGTITAYGGNDGAAAIGGGMYNRAGTVIINGGSIDEYAGSGAQGIGNGKNPIEETSVTNAAGDRVYLTRITLSGVTTRTAITSMTISAEYNIRDMKTNADGRLHLFLPDGTTVTAVSTSSKNYFGTVTTSSEIRANKIFYPIVVSEVSFPVAGTYYTGQALDFAVDFTDNVTVNIGAGVPYIPLTVGNTPREAAYVSGSGNATLHFRYVILPGENDLDGISIGNSIELNGGTIQGSDDSIAGTELKNVDSATGILVDTPPIVTISSPAADPTNLNPIPVMMTFSEDVTDFDIDDLTVGNGVSGNLSGSGMTYTAEITPSSEGPVTVDIGAGATQDSTGNFNTAAVQFSINYDSTAPTVAISSPAADQTNLNPVPVTITFSESVTGFDLADLTVVNGVPDNLSGSGMTYTAEIIPSAEGPVTVGIAAGVAQDAAGNLNTAAAPFSVNYDSMAPTVGISSPAADPTNLNPIPITITFSKIVTGFELADLTVSNGVPDNLSGIGTTYTAEIIPSAEGPVTVDIAAGVAQDTAGNLNTAATPFSVNYDSIIPSVYSILPADGSINVLVSGNVGITFSEEMDIGSGTITLTPSVGSAVTLIDGIWSGGNTVYTMPYGGLAYDTAYTLLATEFKDVANNSIPAISHGFATELEPLIPTALPDSLTIVKGGTASISVALGQGTAAAASASVTVSDGAIAAVNETSLTANGSVVVSGLEVGTTDITVDFYDTGGALHTTATVSVSVVPAAPASRGGGSKTATVKAENGAMETVHITTSGSNVSAVLSPVQGDALSGGAALTLTLPTVSKATSYGVMLPADNLSRYEGGTLTINTELGSISMPSDMLSPLSGTSGQTVQITIGRGEVSSLPGNVREKIGDKPLIQLTMSINGKQTAWSNHNAPVTVSIPFTPTAEELANPENIVVWYIEGDGTLSCVTNGRYNPLTGMVVFRTTHFSDYAVDYNPVGFSDVVEGAWYCKAVNYLAARGITSGTGGGRFSPDAKLTRGEFIVMLMRAYGISPDNAPTDNFSDAGNTYYTGYLAAAKRFGLADGVGNNRFAPERDISRQEMFALLYKNLTEINRVPQGDESTTISVFSDAGQIKPWAKDAIAVLVGAGIVEGNTGKLSPTNRATRAEMAQLIYKLEYLMQFLQTQ